MLYVSDDAIAKAREIEARFAALPESSGVLFISVAAMPAEDGESRCFLLRIGLRRNLTELTGRALVQHLCAAELDKGYFFTTDIILGVSGPCRDFSSPTAG